jgi:O-antigen ligase
VGVDRVDIAFYLFMGLFLGFVAGSLSADRRVSYETEISVPYFILIIVLSISALITIFRYSNFYPFITAKFHDIVVSFGKYTAVSSMLWTLKYYFNYIAGFGLFVIVTNSLRKNRDFFNVIRIIVLAALVVITFGLYQAFFDPSFLNSSFWVGAGRINSTLSDPNALGSYVILLFALFFSFIIFLKKWYLKAASLAFLAVFLFIGFVSGSRSSFLSIFISLSIFAVIGISMPVRRALGRKIKSPNKSAVFSAIIVVAAVIILLSVLLGLFLNTDIIESMDVLKGSGIILLDRVVEMVQNYSEGLRSEGFEKAFRTISSGREILWRQAFYMLKDHPVAGVGTGAYFVELPDYHRRYHRGFHLYDFTGNYYLQVLAELGLVGAILNLFIFFLIIKKSIAYFLNKNSRRLLKKSDWLLGGLSVSFVSMAVALFFGSHTNFIEIQLLFWLIAGLIISYIKINDIVCLSGLRSENMYYLIDDPANNAAVFDHCIPDAVVCSRPVLRTGSFSSIRLGRLSKILLAFIIIIFAASLFKASITDLSVNAKQTLYWNEEIRNNYGFYDLETIEGEQVRWAGLDASQVIKNDGTAIIFSVKDRDPLSHDSPLFVRIYIDNWPVKIIKINDRQWHEVKIDLSPYQKEKLTFTIACSRGWTPKERGISNDTRLIGVLFKEETGFIK